MTKTKLINQCKFPAMIAGKMKLTQVKSRKTDKRDYTASHRRHKLQPG